MNFCGSVPDNSLSSDSSAITKPEFEHNIFDGIDGWWSFQNIGDAQSRCCNQGCIAKAFVGPGELVSKVINHSKKVSVYF